MTTRRSLFTMLAAGGAALIARPAQSKPQTLAAVMATIERRFECKSGLLTGHCQTGEWYLTLMGGGIKEEGAEVSVWYATASEAVAAWLTAFDKYAAGRSGRLYWRTKPEIACDPESMLFQVYSRLAITDRVEMFHRELVFDGNLWQPMRLAA